MSIEIGSKWVKDEEVVEVFNIDYVRDEKNLPTLWCVYFLDIKQNLHILTERDFLEQYKPYEPVYEYRYCFSSECSYDISSRYFTDNEVKPAHWLHSQRLDFTKRERKQ